MANMPQNRVLVKYTGHICSTQSHMAMKKIEKGLIMMDLEGSR